VLDHFLPRSLVVHDRLSNLSRVDPGLNDAKRDRLLDLAFVGPLAAQHAAAGGSADRLPERPRRIWRRGLDDPTIDLRIATGQEASVAGHERLAESCSEVFGSLARIASRMGFSPGRRPSKQPVS
jgi:hypothetical protein